APRARFQGTRAEAVFALAEAPLPILEMAGGATLAYLREPAAAFELSPPVLIQSAALMLERGLRDRSADPLRVGDERVRLALRAACSSGSGRCSQGRRGAETTGGASCFSPRCSGATSQASTRRRGASGSSTAPRSIRTVKFR